MSVSASVTLPAQPAIGSSSYLPLGGNGKQAPHGCYVVEAGVVGDAGGGTASITVNLDTRYTNLVAYMNPQVISAAAAPDFHIFIGPGVSVGGAPVTICGTMPHTVIGAPNAAFLWYPPPMYFRQGGTMALTMLNVDVTETYSIVAQIYTFDPQVTLLTPLPLLQWNVPGVSAPAAI